MFFRISNDFIKAFPRGLELALAKVNNALVKLVDDPGGQLLVSSLGRNTILLELLLNFFDDWLLNLVMIRANSLSFL